ncbi:hypothetical protein HRG_013220 [Hirsutella rhossiliensis]
MRRRIYHPFGRSLPPKVAANLPGIQSENGQMYRRAHPSKYLRSRRATSGRLRGPFKLAQNGGHAIPPSLTTRTRLTPQNEFDDGGLFDKVEPFTRIQDLNFNDADGFVDADVEDQVQLFGGNVHPPEYYREAVEKFNETAYEAQDYSDGSLLLLDACDAQWRQYVTNDIMYCEVLGCDPKNVWSLSRVQLLRLLYNFLTGWQEKARNEEEQLFEHILESLPTRLRESHWRQTRPETKSAYAQDLSRKHDLSDQRRANRCMTIEDLKEQIETTISTTKNPRPTSILRLRFGDIRLALVKDPEGGPHNILIRFTLAFTKTYLGVKDAKTFPLPETLADPSLLLNPHIFLLGILFRHRAFRATSLNSPAQLANLDIHPEERELPLPLKDDLKDTYIFRRAMKTFTGYELSQDKPLSYQMIAQWIRRVGEILGLEYPTIPYNLRYNAANEFDRSGSSSPPITIALLLTPASADISESLRNLALDHANSNPFQKHYLGREQALIRQACSVGHSISKRRPTDLTAEQIASVSTDPIIKRLEQDLRHHRPGSKKHMELRRRLRNEKQRLKRVLKQKIRDEWTARQAVGDIEGQLQGIGFVKQATVNTPICPQRPAQKRLVEALAAPLGNTLEGQYRRRDNAITAIVAYCTVEEGQTIRGARASVDSTRPTLMNEPPINSPQHTALMSTFIKTVTDRPRRCFICVGKALDLTSDDGAVEVLIREFYTPETCPSTSDASTCRIYARAMRLDVRSAICHWTIWSICGTMLYEYTEHKSNVSLGISTVNLHRAKSILPNQENILSFSMRQGELTFLELQPSKELCGGSVPIVLTRNIFITTCVLGSYLFQCVLAVLCNKPIVKDNHVGGIVSALSRGKCIDRQCD